MLGLSLGVLGVSLGGLGVSLGGLRVRFDVKGASFERFNYGLAIGVHACIRRGLS